MFVGEKIMEKFREKDFYKQRIIEMLDKIENQEILIKIFIFIKTWLEE